MAGYIQLLTSGPQDVFFTINPDYTHFIEKFKIHSNFSRQDVDIEPESKADFGTKVRFIIPKDHGDLLKTLSIKCTLPEIVNPGFTCYIESVGHALIEYADLYIGGKLIQRITSDYLQIYSEHNVTQTKQKALEELVGKYPLRTTDRRVSTTNLITNNTLGLNTDEEFYIDLPFYFYNHPELALPLCAIQNDTVEVELKLRPIQDLVIKVNGTKADTVEGLEIKEFQLATEIVFVDKYEKLLLEKRSRDYIITQLQQDVFEIDKGVSSGKFKLEFMNPVKELYFIIQRQGSVGTGQGEFVTPFDYDNTEQVIDNKYVLYENLDYLTLTFDGQDIITRDTGNVAFLKALQAAIHHSKTQLIRRFYSYSFALQPEEWYPTGQINMSLVKEQILNLSLTSCPQYARQIRVYAVSYNVLRVAEGKARTLFDSRY